MALGALTTGACAQIITVPNFSFETPGGDDYGNQPFQSGSAFAIPTPIPGWTYSDFGTGGTASGSQALKIAPSAPFPASASTFSSAGTSDGSSFGFLNLETPGVATITSGALGGGLNPYTIQANTTYTLTVALGNNLTPDTDPYGATGDRSISLLAHGVAFATTIALDGTTPNGTFQDATLTFTTGSADAHPRKGTDDPVGGAATQFRHA